MAINLLDMIKDQVGDSVISSAGKFLGESDSGVKSAMGAALPSILGSLIAKSGSGSNGASGIMDMLSKGNHDGSIFDNLGGLLGGGDATSGFLNSGSGILKSLLGNKLGSVVDIIASVSGLKKGSSSSIMSMAAPLVMGMLGKYVKNKAMDAIGLSKFLGGQSKHVASALPAGMGNLLGFSGSTPSTPNAPKASMPSGSSSGGGGFMKKALPILGLLLVGWGVWNFVLKDSALGDAAKDATEAVGDAAGGAVDAVGDAAGAAAGAVGDVADATKNAAGNAVDAAKDAAGAVGDAAKGAANKAGEMAGDVLDAATTAARAALDKISFAAGSVGDKFSTYLKGDMKGDGTFRFLNLKFATGASSIAGASMSEVDNLAAVLKAYPNVAIEVGGHTDNTGNLEMNNKLSQARAEAVKARLVAQGISADRITAKGYGPSAPVASNDTTEGKQQNRRTEVKVIKK